MAAYQSLIDTVYKACDSARQGKVEDLKQLVTLYNLNLNISDYDRCTPLYFAVRA